MFQRPAFIRHLANILPGERATPLWLAATAALLSSCASPENPNIVKTASGEKKLRVVEPARSHWHGDGKTGARKIVINLSDQRLRYYIGGELVGMTPIASGTSSHPTPTGSYRVTEKDVDHRSSSYGDFVDSSGNVVVGDVDSRKDKRPAGSRFLGARMHYFLRFNGPVGMHEGFLPGLPASHGCVRLPTDMARIIYNVTPHGTPVQVVGYGGHAKPERSIAVGQPSLEPREHLVKVPAAKPKEEKKSRYGETSALAQNEDESVRKAVPLTRKERKALDTGAASSASRGQTFYWVE